MNSQIDHIYSQDRIQSFTQKYSSQLCKDFDLSKVKCGIINLDELYIAGQLINIGELVAFPTETVYGLGANALNEIAVKSIYSTKRRPLTDPVIVHLNNSKDISGYLKNSELDHLQLGEELWPGPFTLILEPDQNKLSTVMLLSANTGFVGFRVPKNAIALELILKAQVPIAAPSANLFSHISPTSPIHVFNDFYDQRVHIIDGPSSDAGIESTVVRIRDKVIEVLRRGSLPISLLRRAMDKIQKYREYTIDVPHMHLDEQQTSMAPGQLLKHYSPNTETYLLRILEPQDKIQHNFIQIDIDQAIIIDYCGYAQKSISSSSNICFKQISNSQIIEAFHNLYEVLRWAENQPATLILLQDIRQIQEDANYDDEIHTLYDKFFRASSGKFILFDTEKQLFYQLY